MQRNIRQPSGLIIHSMQFSRNMQDRMLFTKCNGILYKLKQSLILLQPLPVDPAHRIILTIRIIISILRISDLISAIDHRHTLTQQHHKKRISHLTLPHLSDIHFSARAFHSTVPGIIIAASILIIFLIRFIVPVIISHHIIQCKTILTRHIVNHRIRIRIPPDTISRSPYHIFVTLQKTPHILQKLRIIPRNLLLCRIFSLPDLILIKIMKHQSGITQNPILH